MRHRSDDGRHCIHTNDRTPPPGYAIEFDLGLVHVFSQPGTIRVVATRDGVFCTPFEGELEHGMSALGYVERAPLPMLEGLELRRDPASGQAVLVAGPADPLFARAEPLGHIGFIESYPINPREPLDVRVDRGMLTLVRRADASAWRHRYAAVERRSSDDHVALGGIWREPRHGCTPLRMHPGGTVDSELLPPRDRAARSLDGSVRWLAAPVRWSGWRPRGWALRASASRTRQLARALPPMFPSPRRRDEPTVLGHLRREPAPGWSPLFAARHPVLADQYLTRSELEARDMGYIVEGILGYVADRRADTTPDAMPHEIKWASRFGHRRRYVEGPVD